MSKLLDLYAKGTITGAPNLVGVDKTPIDAEKEPFAGSKDLAKSDLTKSMGGVLGSGSPIGYGGYDNTKTYESQIGAK